MLISYHYIDSEIWDGLPKEAQEILKDHHYRPFCKLDGASTRTSYIDGIDGMIIGEVVIEP